MFFRRAPSLRIGRLERASISRCAEIHADSFRRGWDENEFAALLRDPSVDASAASDARTGRVLGFVLSRRALDEADILTIAVDRKARGSGVAKALLGEHLAALAERGVVSWFLEVDSTNKPALALYARAGFARVGERRGYYAAGDAPAATALILRREAR